MAQIGGANPTSAQRWVHGAQPRGPALARLRRAARLARGWPSAAPPLRLWLTAPKALLNGRTPARWIGADGADLPLAELWREVTGASTSAAAQIFTSLQEDVMSKDASIAIAARAMRDLDTSGISTLLASLQGTASISRFIGADLIVAAEANRRMVAAPMQPSIMEAIAVPTEQIKLATLGLWNAVEPYQSIANRMADILASQVTAVDNSALREMLRPQIDLPWTALSFPQLAYAVDTSLSSSVGAALDAYAGLITPFGIEASAWARWLPQHAEALLPSIDAKPEWLAASSHVLTRTAIAASAPEREARDDDEQVQQAVQAGLARGINLTLVIPGTRSSLEDVLARKAPAVLESFRGANEALARKGPDAARHVAVSIREAVVALSRALVPSLPNNAQARERWEKAADLALKDPHQKRLVSAHIEILLTLGDATGGAIHRGENDFAYLELLMSATSAAVGTVLSSYVLANGGTV